MNKILFLFIPFVLFANKPQLLLLKTYKDQNITDWVMNEKLDIILLSVVAHNIFKSLINSFFVYHVKELFNNNLANGRL